MKYAKNWLEILAGISLVVVVLSTFLQVVFRFLLKIPAPWMEEVTRIAFVYMTLLGASIAVKNSNHLSVDVISKLPNKLKKVIVSLGYICSILFVALFAYYGWQHSLDSIDQTTPTLEISMLYLYIAMPISGIIMAYYLVKNMINELKNAEKEEISA